MDQNQASATFSGGSEAGADQQRGSPSNDNNQTPLRRFLSCLNAREIPATPATTGYPTFVLQPGVYAKTLESLEKSDCELWAFVSDSLR